MRSVLTRVGLMVGALVVAVGLLYDPYTTALQADTPFLPAPLGRMVVIGLEFGLLIAYGICIWTHRTLQALIMLALASLVDVGLNIWLVSTHGVARFAVVYGTAEILSIYLVFIAIRIILLTATALLMAPMSTRYSAPAE